MSDFALIHADDMYLDMLSAGARFTGDPLAHLLSAWRDDVDSEPISVGDR